MALCPQAYYIYDRLQPEIPLDLFWVQTYTRTQHNSSNGICISFSRNVCSSSWRCFSVDLLSFSLRHASVTLLSLLIEKYQKLMHVGNWFYLTHDGSATMMLEIAYIYSAPVLIIYEDFSYSCVSALRQMKRGGFASWASPLSCVAFTRHVALSSPVSRKATSYRSWATKQPLRYLVVLRIARDHRPVHLTFQVHITWKLFC